MRLRDYTPADRAACLAVFGTNVPEFFTEPDPAAAFQLERVIPDGVAPGLDRCDMRLALEGRGQRVI